MNYISHNEVARRLSDDEDHSYMFGSIAPDLVGMFGLKKTYDSTSNSRVKEGIDLHHKTDSIFDGLVEIKALQTSIMSDIRLTVPNPPRHFALACARAGKDILFDSIHFEGNKTAVFSYFKTITQAHKRLIDITGLAEPISDLHSGVGMIYDFGMPSNSEPRAVAIRLHRRLKNTRMNFDESLISPLGKVIEKHASTVLRIGESVMDQVVTKVAS